MAEYTVGVIGTGGMGSRHGRVYSDLADCELVACADLDTARAREFAGEVGVDDEHVYAEYGAMFDAVDLDVVSVATPIPTHGAVLLDCLRRGDLRAVHCEKPMADTWGECRLVAQEAARRGVQLTFNHQLRCSEPARRAKELLEEGAVGELTRVEMARGDVYEAGTHQMDLCSYFAGDVPAAWVLGQVDYREEEIRNGAHIEDQALGLWAYENGVHGLASTGDGEDAVGCHQRLVGTGGTIEVAFWDDDPVRVRRDGAWETVDCALGDPLHEAIAHVVDCIGSGEEPTLSARNALVGTEVIYGIWESSRRRGRVDCPLTVSDNPLRAMVEAGDLDPA